MRILDNDSRVAYDRSPRWLLLKRSVGDFYHRGTFALVFIHCNLLRTPRTVRQLSPSFWDAPRGRVTLAVHYIEKGDALAQTHVALFQEALEALKKVERNLLPQFQGYECGPDPSFSIASFAEPLAAVKWCLKTQEDLLLITWSAGILSHSCCTPVRDESGKQLLFNGVRVQMGVCMMNVEASQVKPDPTNGEARYFGPLCNRSARVAAAAHGGQVLICGEELYDIVLAAQNTEVTYHLYGYTCSLTFLFQVPELMLHALGSFELKGIAEPIALSEVASLPRTFPPPNLAPL